MTDEMKDRNNSLEADLNDPTLQAAMRDFHGSVHAWSDAAYNRPRPVLAAAPARSAWRRSAAWVLSLMLSFGIFGTAAWEHHHQGEVAARQQQQELERERILAAQKEKETEELMANIDSDVSRQVPSAMEPLADLMTDDSR